MFKDIIEKEINKEVEIIKRFSGGMSNYTFLIKVNNQLYTYRIPGENSEVFIDREIEFENINRIEKLNLNCKNIYFNKDNGHKMSIYIEGEDLTDISFDFSDVASKLLYLHNSGIRANNNYDPLKRLEFYEKLVKNENKEYLYLKNKIVDLLSLYKDVELVFCHGDSQKANWLKSDSLYLLDWEYSGNNDPFYDIACFGNKDLNDAILLLAAYLKREPTNSDLKRMFTYRMFQCLQWHNVALYKHHIKLSEKLNIDFNIISMKYLKLAQELYGKISVI